MQEVIQVNSKLLDEHGLIGTLAEVEYIEGLKNPDDEVQERIYQIMFDRDRDINVACLQLSQVWPEGLVAGDGIEPPTYGVMNPKL